MIFTATLLLALANSWYFDEFSLFQLMPIITATLELRASEKSGNQKHYIFLSNKKKKISLGICTLTSDEITDRDKERRNFSVRVLLTGFLAC